MLFICLEVVLMDKELLRDALFQKYFQIEDGILISDFLDKLSFIPKTWQELHTLCEKNIRYFDSFSSLETCKILKHNKKKYFIIKLGMWNYVIIDIEKMENVEQSMFVKEFDEKFFVNNFQEQKEDDDSIYSSLYQIEKYEGDIQKLVNFYIQNQNILQLSTDLYYKLKLENAWTWLYINFINANLQIGFQTPDHSLYEQLFLRYDLTPYKMQDAQQKMGIEKMQEIFAKIKYIKIPIESIPNDLYQEYLKQCNKDINKTIIKKYKSN